MASRIQPGHTLAQASQIDLDYRVRVQIEIDNLTNYGLDYPTCHIEGGVLSYPPTFIRPYFKEAMVARESAHAATGS